MLRIALKESGRFALGVFGASLVAAAVSAVSVADTARGMGGFATAMAGRMVAFARLDFGTSAISGLSAAHELAARGPTTLIIVLAGGLIAIIVGAPLGLLLGAGPLRRATAPLVQIVAAAPVFCAGLTLAYAAQHLRDWQAGAAIWPVALLHSDPAALGTVILPGLTVGLAGAAAVQLALRRAAAEAQDEPFRSGLRRLGLPAWEIDRVYVAPLVFARLVACLGEVMLALLSAAVVAEWVFQCPGIADLFVKSVALHDWNIAALVVFVFAAAALLADFAGRLAAHAVASAPS